MCVRFGAAISLKFSSLPGDLEFFDSKDAWNGEKAKYLGPWKYTITQMKIKASLLASFSPFCTLTPLWTSSGSDLWFRTFMNVSLPCCLPPTRTQWGRPRSPGDDAPYPAFWKPGPCYGGCELCDTNKITMITFPSSSLQLQFLFLILLQNYSTGHETAKAAAQLSCWDVSYSSWHENTKSSPFHHPECLLIRSSLPIINNAWCV